jgi:hypothetical protein
LLEGSGDEITSDDAIDGTWQLAMTRNVQMHTQTKRDEISEITFS